MYRLLFFTLLTSLAWANPNEMLSDKQLEKKFVSLIKENEIEELIKKTSDYNDCRDMNQFVEKDTQSDREAKAKKAQDCFEKKIIEKDTKSIQALSENLGLESYQLVKSKNIKDITGYLGKRMRKALTGVDEEDQKNEAKLANMKFKDKQFVNQDDIFRLYTYQLTKNALLEVSRYCFENFTNTTPTQNQTSPSMNSFLDHWSAYFNAPNKENLNLSVSDTGKHTWGTFSDSTDVAKTYNEIFSGIGRADPKQLGDFWEFCTKKMKELCDQYKPDSGSTVGANSCLTMNRLRNMRNAISSSEKVQEYMSDKMGHKEGTSVKLDQGASPKFFQADDKENSFDSLTNFSSHELLTGDSKQSFNELLDQCQKKPESADCDKFIAEGSSSPDKLIHKIDQEMRFKQAAEKARLLKIKEDNEANFKEYLEKNGYFDLAQKNEIKDTDIEEYLNRTFDAQRVAITDQLRKSVGSRQVVSNASKEVKEQAIRESAQETAQERARLSQVILFNNIITSNLNLLDANKNPIGKNVGAWKKESEALTKANIDQTLFDNIQGVVDTTGKGKNSSIKGTEFIDIIIGKTQSSGAK